MNSTRKRPEHPVIVYMENNAPGGRDIIFLVKISAG
jgi:hypothetical protein